MYCQSLRLTLVSKSETTASFASTDDKWDNNLATPHSLSCKIECGHAELTAIILTSFVHDKKALAYYKVTWSHSNITCNYPIFMVCTPVEKQTACCIYGMWKGTKEHCRHIRTVVLKANDYWKLKFIMHFPRVTCRYQRRGCLAQNNYE